MTQEEFGILTRDKIRQVIEANLDTNPVDFALTYSTNEIPTALVSTQLKNLQKAKKKCPSYYRARCIIPGKAYEQASSELTASLKIGSGARFLDLSMGLGVDTAHFARHFDQVIALEPNPVLAEIGRHNMQLLGISNVQIYSQKAEDFLSTYEGPTFDLIYVDPSRRDEQGNRLLRLQDCQPPLLDILPRMEQLSKECLIKLSPLFDVQEAIRQLSSLSSISIVSVGNDCKELLVRICDKQNGKFPTSEIALDLQMIRKGEMFSYSFLFPFQAISAMDLPMAPKYLYEADVAIYKARALPTLMKQYFSHLSGSWNDPMGFFFSSDSPIRDFPGRIWQIQEELPYKPRHIRKWLKANDLRQAHILKRRFPLSVKEIRQQLNLKEGGETYLIGTEINGVKTIFVGKLLET